jgi:hypothetical protein
MEILVSHPLPLLRGLVKVEGEELTWTGKWAFGKEGHAEKKTNKFALRTPLSSVAGVSAEGKIESAATITFSGFFKLTKTEGGGGRGDGAESGEGEEKKVVKIKEENVKIAFKKQEGKTGYDISGTGKNKFGDFFLVGSYSSEKNQMWAKKEYIEEDEDFSENDDSEDEDDGIEDDGYDDIAAELADLREDAAYHQITLDTGATEKKARRDDGGVGAGSKKNLKRKALEGAAPVVAAASEAGGGGGGGVAKKAKIPDAMPGTEWSLNALQASKSRLQLIVDTGEVAGILMVLDELASGGKVTVPLLQDTQIGRDVKTLKKHADHDVASKAGAIIDMWKSMVR